MVKLIKLFVSRHLLKLHQLGLLALLLIVLLTVAPQVAQADKTAAAYLFDPGSTSVNVAEIYETTATTQKDIVTTLMKSSKSFFKKTPGFGSFSVLQSADGERVLSLTQWQDAASYEAYLAQPAEDSKSSKKKETAPVAPTRTILFEIDDTLAATGMVPAIRGKDALVQFNEITAKSLDDLPKLVDAAETLLPSIKQVFPSPRSAVLLKAVDGTDIALLTNWGSAAEYGDLTAVPALDSLDPDLLSLAESDLHLYQVVKTIVAKPAKPDKD
ncbi:MAG: antibiotic biosynthesis monooxygenase [Pegethrix bostrychoides GSE-TBD4-15B]|uniref:Antibiotic biosynthesis monooxygenase n=1 Tax=Pegethrix bostrychoides GSE-TBD4-15B TaxID=2839662 RepID=A0A951PDK2_9CYAN|nr:antibiotic biosynthesis monooxygenase [Pegethrix bostrychoides GSE-TBD4-15B]